MRLRNVLAAAAAVSLLVPGPAAAAQSARALSLSGSPMVQRAGANLQEPAELGGRRGYGWILGLVALGILIFVVTELSKNNDLPGSP